MASRARPLSPNHLERRRQIVQAAQTILLRSGPAACSSREIAKETGLTKGLIHYYFANVNEIIETAMGDLLDRIMGRIRDAGEGHDDPTDRFWAVVEEYLAVFSDEPGLTLLWFDWWVRENREGELDSVKRVQDGLIDLLAQVLGEAGVPDAPTRARALLSYVIGVLVRRAVDPQSFEELKPEVADLCRIEAG